LRFLNIYNVNVNITGEPLMSFPSTHLCLTLHDMLYFPVILAMVNFLRPYALNLVNCSAGADMNGFGNIPYRGTLHLNIMDEEEDLAPLLKSWHGGMLE